MSSTSSSTSSSIGPITGEDIDDGYYAGGLSPTMQSKAGLPPFENQRLLRPIAVGEADRNSEGHFTASKFHVIGDYSSVTAPDDSCVAPDISFKCLINLSRTMRTTAT